MVNYVDTMDKAVEETMPELMSNELLNTFIQMGIEDEKECPEEENQLKEGAEYKKIFQEKLPEIKQEDKLISRLEKVLKMELKPLPNHLKYIFLWAGDTLPVIISFDLTIAQEERVRDVL